MTSIRRLEDELSCPSNADRAFMRRLEGDILLLGAGGKMGPSLARRARRAADQAGRPRRIIAVSRFASGEPRQLAGWGIEAIACDLLDRDRIARLPDCANVLFLAGRKFGSTDNMPLTWATNTLVPALVAERFRGSRIVALSSGNVYPLAAHGATEATTPAPVGEYAQSVLGRERVFEYFSSRDGTPVSLIRLNYAVDLRYGVLLDIGRRVWQRQPGAAGHGIGERHLAGRREFDDSARAGTGLRSSPRSECHGTRDTARALDRGAVRRTVRYRAAVRRARSGNRAAQRLLAVLPVARAALGDGR